MLLMAGDLCSYRLELLPKGECFFHFTQSSIKSSLLLRYWLLHLNIWTTAILTFRATEVETKGLEMFCLFAEI